MTKRLLFSIILLINLLASCKPTQESYSQTEKPVKVIAIEPFLADIAQNVAGDRLKIDSFLPTGIDPHAFEPSPADIARLSDATAIVINGAGLETWLDKNLTVLENNPIMIIASDGLISRTANGDDSQISAPVQSAPSFSEPNHQVDPHFWMNPLLTIYYVENIRDNLVQIDPEGAASYQKNAEDYIQQLKDLDDWIAAEVNLVPEPDRLLVTNHESLGYFADRYGFKIIGTILPSTSSLAEPSIHQLAGLIASIQANHVKAVFLEHGSNPDLAKQLAAETNVKVIDTLYSHFLSAPNGPAPNYLMMMRYNTKTIIDALGGKELEK